MFLASVHEIIRKNVLVYLKTFVPVNYYIYGSMAQNVHVPLWAQVQPRDLDIKISAICMDDFFRRCNDMFKFVMDKMDLAFQPIVTFSFRKNQESTHDVFSIYVQKVTCVDIVLESHESFLKRKIQTATIEDIDLVNIISLEDLVHDNKIVLEKCTLPYRLKKEQQRRALFEKLESDKNLLQINALLMEKIDSLIEREKILLAREAQRELELVQFRERERETQREAKRTEEHAARQAMKRAEELAVEKKAVLDKLGGMFFQEMDKFQKSINQSLNGFQKRIQKVEKSLVVKKEEWKQRVECHKMDEVHRHYAYSNLIQKMHELLIVKESQVQALTVGVKQYEITIETELGKLSTDLIHIMYGGDKETTMLFIQQFIHRILRRFPVLSQEEAILNLGMRNDELLFDYMTRISNYLLSHYHDNLASSPILKIPGLEYFCSCHTDEHNMFNIARYAADLPKDARETLTGTCILKREEEEEAATRAEEEDDPEDLDTSLIHFESADETSLYKGFSKQNNIKICLDTKNLDAEKAWRAERLDRFKSKDMYETTYGMAQMVSNNWFLMHRIMMYSGLKIMDAAFSRIHDEYTKFKYVSVNVGVIDYKKTVSLGNVMEEYATLYPQVFKQTLKDLIPLYKGGKLKTDQFMLDMANEIRQKKELNKKREHQTIRSIKAATSLKKK